MAFAQKLAMLLVVRIVHVPLDIIELRLETVNCVKSTPIVPMHTRILVARAEITLFQALAVRNKIISVMLVLTGVHVLRAKKIRINRVLVRRRVLIVHLACVDESGQLAWAGRLTLGQAGLRP
jgi:hypothetical protein